MMKHRFVRGMGVLMALAISLGALSMVGSATAGALGSTVKVKATIGSLGSLTCPKVALKAKGSTKISTCATSGSIGGFAHVTGALSGISTTSLTAKSLAKTTTKIALTGTVTCTITLKKSIALTQSGTTFTGSKKLTSTAYSVTPTSFACTLIKGAIKTQTASLTIKVS
jgi:hypothetical protein